MASKKREATRMAKSKKSNIGENKWRIVTLSLLEEGGERSVK